jgi:hypothetical protein
MARYLLNAKLSSGGHGLKGSIRLHQLRCCSASAVGASISDFFEEPVAPQQVLDMRAGIPTAECWSGAEYSRKLGSGRT